MLECRIAAFSWYNMPILRTCHAFVGSREGNCGSMNFRKQSVIKLHINDVNQKCGMYMYRPRQRCVLVRQCSYREFCVVDGNMQPSLRSGCSGGSSSSQSYLAISSGYRHCEYDRMRDVIGLATSSGLIPLKQTTGKPANINNKGQLVNSKPFLLMLGMGIMLLSPGASHAAEIAPEGFLDTLFRTVDSLGPLGPLVYVLAVMVCECIPLFPTQPLSIASGLLFGTSNGALIMITGTTLAALLAFFVSRGVGRPLAERIIKKEMSEGAVASTDSSDSLGPVQAKLMEVQETIERGTFFQQASAILVLRLTPIVPFSASNYILGLSPLPVLPYFLGTLVGMTFWCTLYASFGGASRALMTNGANTDLLLQNLLEKAGNVTGKAGIIVFLVGGIGALIYFSTRPTAVSDLSNATSKDDTKMNSIESASGFNGSMSEDFVESISKE